MATLADFRAYATERGNSAPADAVDVDAEAALVRAGDYIRDTYTQHFLAEHSAPLPDAVESATYEAAIYELVEAGFFSKTYTEAAQKELVGVGNIKWEFIGRKGGAQAPTSTKIDAMLRPFMAGATKALLRA